MPKILGLLIATISMAAPAANAYPIWPCDPNRNLTCIFRPDDGVSGRKVSSSPKRAQRSSSTYHCLGSNNQTMVIKTMSVHKPTYTFVSLSLGEQVEWRCSLQ